VRKDDGARTRQKASRVTAKRANLARETRAAIAAAPCRLTALARAADLSHTTLVKIRRGTFLATPVIARKLAGIFERWGASCQRVAQRLRRAARQVPGSRAKRVL
jgi:DNA-binding XRE family transcriptional regulator